MIQVEELRAAFDYDPYSGLLTWKIGRRNGVKVGDVAGSLDSEGYLRIGFKGIVRKAHSIAWAIMTGEWSKSEIDHRDLDKANNRWTNLRQATDAQNNYNRLVRSDSLTGAKGVYRRANGKFTARISKGGKRTFLGDFESIVGASLAYEKAAFKIAGQFARI